MSRSDHNVVATRGGQYGAFAALKTAGPIGAPSARVRASSGASCLSSNRTSGRWGAASTLCARWGRSSAIYSSAVRLGVKLTPFAPPP